MLFIRMSLWWQPLQTEKEVSAKVLGQESAWKIQGMVRRLLKLERQKVIVMGGEFEEGLGGQGLTIHLVSSNKGSGSYSKSNQGPLEMLLIP